MALKTAQQAVTNVASILQVVETDYTAGYNIVVKNTGANTIYLGNSNVSSVIGLPVAAGALSPSIPMSKGSNLYARCGGVETSTLAFIATGV